jgi:UDP-glucose 4-epimerase
VRVKILVTGGAGFIGSHLVNRLSGSGNIVTVIDNLSTGTSRNLENFTGEIVQSDIRNERLVSDLVSKSDVVFHLAASVGVNRIMENPIESISVNVLGSQIVLTSAAKHKKRIVIASTSEVYGRNPKQPLSESDDRVVGTPQNFRWSYSDAKALEEAMAHALFLKKELQVTTVRFFNTVGPRQTGQYGMVIPRFVKAAINGEDLNVFGNGKQTRVFCHVSDAIDGVISLLNEPGSIGQAFNIGGIGEVSINDLAENVIEITKSKSRIMFKDYQDAYPTGYEDIQRRVPDIRKIKSLTGWTPKKDLFEIIKDVARDLS